MRKAYIHPKMYVHALACADGLLQVNMSLNGSGNASEHNNPPMDTKGDWGDIWEE